MESRSPDQSPDSLIQNNLSPQNPLKPEYLSTEPHVGPAARMRRALRSTYRPGSPRSSWPFRAGVSHPDQDGIVGRIDKKRHEQVANITFRCCQRWLHLLAMPAVTLFAVEAWNLYPERIQRRKPLFLRPDRAAAAAVGGLCEHFAEF